MIRLGMLEPAGGDVYAHIGFDPQAKGVDDPWQWEKNKALARKVTDESIVLLKNEGHLLPLDAKTVKSIAVIGPMADKVALDWYSGTPPYTVTPVAGIRERLGPTVSVQMSTGSDLAEAAALAKQSDVAIVIIGNHPTCDAGWAKCPLPSDGKEAIDRKTLTLAQEDIAKAVLAANPKTIVVLQASFPFTTTWTQENVPAILEMTHNSEEQGNGLADVLFGDYNPAGRLSQTWVANEQDLPPMMDYDLRHGRTYLYLTQKPLYAFGYGLSYTTFAYSNLKVSAPKLKQDGTEIVSVDVKNTGSRAGDEVVQLYVSHQGSAVARPIEELKGFQRVNLKPGEVRTVTMKLPASVLAYWDDGSKKMVVEADRVQVSVGGSSDKLPLHTVVQVVQ
jgi:beta-glucosidase